MGTFNKGILGGFSGKVGNVVGAYWRGKNVMRSLPQHRHYDPSPAQLKQQLKFSLVVKFLNPMKAIVGKYFGKMQGDRSPFNMATSYHLREAVLLEGEGFVMDYPKVLISKGDLRGMTGATLTANPDSVLSLSWTDNSGEGFAQADDMLVAAVYAPDGQLYKPFFGPATRGDAQVDLQLPVYFSGLPVQVWATFVSATPKKGAATSVYLGTVVVS